MRGAAWVLALALCVLAAAASVSRAGQAPPSLSGLPRDEAIRLGERMYREGILPSGAPMPGFIRGDVEVDSSAFSCSSCHLRAGLGSFEGGVVTPPTTGRKLYQSYRRPPSLREVRDAGRAVYAKTIEERPPYDRETLAAALRFGVDPARQVFNDVMPRYPLGERDMAVLIDYLEALSAEPSPGAEGDEMRFATVIAGEVSPEDRRALLGPIERFVEERNRQFAMYQEFLKQGYTPTIDMLNAFRKATLDVWELKGPAESWPDQLAARYRERPPFALLGGISYGSWRPVHDFCEKMRLPCLFPVTDFPVVSESDWYTYYFDKGYFQEGEAAARYLNRLERLPGSGVVLQVVQDDPAARAVASGFSRGWSDVGRPAVITVAADPSLVRDPEQLAELVRRHRPGVLVLWGDAGALPALPAAAAGLPSSGMLFLSSGLLGKKAGLVPESLRDRVYLSWPYRLTPYVGPKDGGFDAKVAIRTGPQDFGEKRIASRTVSALRQVVLRGLNLIYDNLYRDHLLDVMGMQMDVTVPDYERISFGPGQRYVSKGCYVIQLGPGAQPELLPRSEWVIH